jgi:dethiobiotin synthetase
MKPHFAPVGGGHAAANGIFVTGTDTGVGKTFVAAALLRALVAEGLRAAGMKPVASGAPAAAAHADVRALVTAGNVAASLADVNPYSFTPAIAPHLAAESGGVDIDVGRIASAYANLAARSDAVVVEGAGGVLVPLSRHADMLDIPARLGLPVLLVVGVRLGCINHALLSALALSARGLRLAGWVANRIDPAMEGGDACVAALAQRLPAPLIADIGWQAGAAPTLGQPRASLELLGLVRATSA